MALLSLCPKSSQQATQQTPDDFEKLNRGFLPHFWCWVTYQKISDRSRGLNLNLSPWWGCCWSSPFLLPSKEALSFGIEWSSFCPTLCGLTGKYLQVSICILVHRTYFEGCIFSLLIQHPMTWVKTNLWKLWFCSVKKKDALFSSYLLLTYYNA